MLSCVPLRMAIITNPAWLMLEYANMRLRLFWLMATMLPTSMVAMLTPINTGRSTMSSLPSTCKMLIIATNPATLLPTDM